MLFSAGVYFSVQARFQAKMAASENVCLRAYCSSESCNAVDIDRSDRLEPWYTGVAEIWFDKYYPVACYVFCNTIYSNASKKHEKTAGLIIRYGINQEAAKQE